MQNKANLLVTQMNVSYCFNKEYENKRLFRRPENKPKQTQFQYKKSGFKSKLLIFDYLVLLLWSLSANLCGGHLCTYVIFSSFSRLTKCPISLGIARPSYNCQILENIWLPFF